MTFSAILFMSVTWLAVSGLVGFCLWRIMEHPQGSGPGRSCAGGESAEAVESRDAFHR